MQVTKECSCVEFFTDDTIVTPQKRKEPRNMSGAQVQAAFAGDGGKYCLGMRTILEPERGSSSSGGGMTESARSMLRFLSGVAA